MPHYCDWHFGTFSKCWSAHKTTPPQIRPLDDNFQEEAYKSRLVCLIYLPCTHWLKLFWGGDGDQILDTQATRSFALRIVFHTTLLQTSSVQQEGSSCECLKWTLQVYSCFPASFQTEGKYDAIQDAITINNIPTPLQHQVSQTPKKPYSESCNSIN